MRELDTNEIKRIQIEILDNVNSFCNENNIKYWLDSGTLLGAIRHNGYIPWDDDLDIGMLRIDFDKFISMFNNKNDRYKVISNDLDSECLYPYAKILDTQTILYEPDEINGVRISVNIDLFVYDLTPGGDETKKQYYIRDKYNFLNNVQFNLYQTKKWYKKIPKMILFLILQFFPKGHFAKMISQNSKQYKNSQFDFVGNFTSISKVLCKKTVFDHTVLWKFEGKLYPVPAGYDEWLTSFYGDYMKLPPVEKRITHHLFKAYIID